ncbi:hypothetical protein AB0J74_22445 [Asanoa sp. NPDC049573]|uniref:hypothetical protein n=1 Tax=Asanoa sp. NPDC049573 TaxID=3155396 RepID=UPI003446C091
MSAMLVAGLGLAIARRFGRAGHPVAGGGALLFVTGLGAVVPLPFMGANAVAWAALRTYALTVNAALDGTGVYAGALVIGGLVEGGDIHRHAVSVAGAAGLPTLDPAAIADVAWHLAGELRRVPAPAGVRTRVRTRPPR